MKILRLESKGLTLKLKKHEYSIFARVPVFDTYPNLMYMANLCISVFFFFQKKKKWWSVWDMTMTWLWYDIVDLDTIVTQHLMVTNCQSFSFKEGRVAIEVCKV